MNVFKYAINKTFGNRTERLYVRLNKYQMGGVRLLAARAGKAPADWAYGLVRDELAKMYVADLGFAKEWDRQSSQIAHKELRK